MNEANISIQIRNFNDKIRVMNQTNSRQLVMTANEARNLHTEIYAILAQLSEYARAAPAEEVTQIQMDGGGFK